VTPSRSSVFGHQAAFGDSAMSRSYAGMVNEVLAKLLYHNLTGLIQEQETLGISPVFWDAAGEDTEPTILKMVWC
jgi:hypothetical protein